MEVELGTTYNDLNSAQCVNLLGCDSLINPQCACARGKVVSLFVRLSVIPILVPLASVYTV